MKKLTLLAATAVISAGALHAAPVIYESFAQTAGSISGKAGGTGLNNWAVIGTAPTVATTPTLDYGELAFSGGQVSVPTGAGQTAYVTTTSALADANLLIDGATVWFSYQYSKGSGGGSNERSGFAFGTDYLKTTVTAGASMETTNGGNGLGVYSRDKSIQPSTWNGGGGGTQGSGTTFANYGDTVLVVGKIVWGATSGDVETLTIWTPDEASLPVNEAGLGAGFSKTMAGVTQTAFTTISMQQRNSNSAQIYDEIRFGAALADVIPVDTVAPTLLSITDAQGGGPIYEDVAVVTYTLTFDRGMDISTITAADFVNAGSATATVGTVTQASGSVIKVQLLPTTTGTLKLRIPATSELKSLAGLDLNTTSNIDDDTTITIQAGTTPLPAFRLWDGSITTGPTDGISNGGNGTWDTSTTNWDYTPGLADPVAWNNANLDTAILGSTAGTISLGEAVTAGGLTSSADYTIQGANTLTLDVTSGAPVVNVTSGTLTINSKISGSDGLQKDSGGTLRLGNNSNDFTGGVTLNAGDLFVETGGAYGGWGPGTLTINGGRVRTNSGGTFTTTNNSIWNASFGVYRGITGTAVWNHNGNVTLGGNVTVTSANNFWTSVVNGVIDETGGSRSLTLAGNGLTLTLNGANTFSGGLTYSTGGTLNINNGGSGGTSSAIGTGLFTISSGTIDNTSGGPITLSTNNTQAWNANITFTGSNDLNLGTGAVTINANRTVTITAGTLTVGGGIGQSGGTRTLTKNGDGTLVLKGANTYAGNTTVSAGTLALVGGSQDSAIVVNGGSLGFTLGSPTTSTKALTLTSGTVKITGTPILSSYLLMTADGFITGTLTLDVPIPGYALQLANSDTELRLNSTGGGSPYDTWAATNATSGNPDDDFDSDGVSNAVEFVLGGDKDTNDLGKLPALSTSGGNMLFTFKRDQDSIDASVSVEIEVGTTLAAWPDSYTVGANTGSSDAGVTVSQNDPIAGTDTVTLSVVQSPDAKKFARLKVVITP